MVELAVPWVVLIALGAFVLGLVGGRFAAGRARPASTPVARPAGTPAAEPEPTAERALAASTTASSADDTSAGDDAKSADGDATTSDVGDRPGHAEVSGHRLAAAGPDRGAGSGAQSPVPVGADLTAAARLERDERARYAEIIGIETENASLRAVAARVPGLERRIRELEAVIEQLAGPSEAVIDLTGPDPVVRRDGAELTSG